MDHDLLTSAVNLKDILSLMYAKDLSQICFSLPSFSCFLVRHQWFSAWGDCVPGDIWHHLKTFLLITADGLLLPLVC